ncbi:MAG TPA: alpha/beta fold hydrolase [Solirubrobacteraceae bacterium]|nr:alpha/beta fold hydrolase [Solirubrobacteraceae bacterium]
MSTLHHVDEGSGPVLLMLHGNPTSSFLYRHVIAALRDRFRCVAPDLPGFGDSTAPRGYGFLPAEHAAAVRRFVEELDLRDYTLVAQDWGGPIGLSAALAEPGRLRALVLANTWAWPLDGDPRARAFSWLLGGPLGRALIRRRNVFVEWMIPAGTAIAGPDAVAMAEYRRPFPTPESRTPTHVFPREIIGSTRWLAGIAADLPLLRDRPALILRGPKDPALGGRRLTRRWERTFPDHRTVVLRGASHYVQEDAPQAMADAIAGWWPSVAAKPSR